MIYYMIYKCIMPVLSQNWADLEQWLRKSLTNRNQTEKTIGLECGKSGQNGTCIRSEWMLLGHANQNKKTESHS